jgi:hypothetical protein
MAVGVFMSFLADAPGVDGSAIVNLFHAIGTLQFVLGLLVPVSAFLLYWGMPNLRTWSGVVTGVGVVSIISPILIAAEGTIGVLILVIPGVLELIAGRLGARPRTVSSA